MRLAAAMLAIVLLAPVPEAFATPENWAACTQSARDMRALRQCSTAREDIAFCERGRTGQGADGPIGCLEEIVRDWSEVALNEELRTAASGERENWQDWLAGRNALCRDPEEMRLSAERFGEGHAGFEAVKCELQQTIRRAIDSVARQRGFR